jgi:hypothetical protein
VLVYLFHNGTLPAQCTEFGSKGHWAEVCGSSAASCGSDIQDCE